jgi:hypothetical protein
MLAMVANDNAGNLIPRGVLGFIASMLAPTEEGDSSGGVRSTVATTAPGWFPATRSG